MNISAWKSIYVSLAALVVLVGGYIASYQTAPPAENVIGAVSGNEVQGSEFIVGGVKHIYNTMAFNRGTSTVCVFNAPQASSTLIRAIAKVPTSTASPSATGDFVIAKNILDTFATTTELAAEKVTANLTAVIVSTTTLSSAADYRFQGNSNERLIFDYNGTTTFQGASGGVCIAEWIVY